jgi:hypothetical protein
VRLKIVLDGAGKPSVASVDTGEILRPDEIATAWNEMATLLEIVANLTACASEYASRKIGPPARTLEDTRNG